VIISPCCPVLIDTPQKKVSVQRASKSTNNVSTVHPIITHADATRVATIAVFMVMVIGDGLLAVVRAKGN
jgi:hypothetical protein